MLKLKLQYFGHLMQRVDSLEKTLMLGGIVGQEDKGMTEETGAKNPSGNVYRSFISPYLYSEELNSTQNQIIKGGLFRMFW